MAVKQKPGQSNSPTVKKLRVLVVCHGNICRSPFAEVYLQKLFGKAVEVKSAGLAPRAMNNGRAAKKVRDWAASNAEVDLEQHRTTYCGEEQLTWADTVLVMNPQQVLAVTQRCADLAKEPRLLNLGEYIGKPGIPDPNFYRGDSSEFRGIMAELKRACELFATVVRARGYK